MRKRKHAVVAMMIAFAMLCPLFQPQVVEAADEGVTINLSELNAQAGETVSITKDGYRIGDTNYTYDGNYIFTGTWNGNLSGRLMEDYTSYEFQSVITVEQDVDADITFQDVEIITNGDSYANPVRIAGDSTGDVTITLKGENYLECNNPGGGAALQKSSYTQLENAGTLTLRCEFSGQEGHVCTDACGSLTAFSRSGPGIGSQGNYVHEIMGDMSSAALCSLHIEGGNIEAMCDPSWTGNSVAAIGTGEGFGGRIMTESGELLGSPEFNPAASEMIQDLVISGGNVYAHAVNGTYRCFAGIGTGLLLMDDTSSSQTANITISGGTVRAQGSSGIHVIRGEVISPGIGQCVPGYEFQSSNIFNIVITGGTVTTETSGFTDGYTEINAGYGIDAHELTISGGSVTAQQGSGISADKLVIGTNSPVIRTCAVAGDTSYETDSDTQGIVFVGDTGTVYGDVVLNEEQTIADGETLTIPESASLTNNGVLTVNGKLINEGRFRNNGSFQYDNGEFICVPHVLEETAEQPATHLKPGNIRYYSCEYCGRIYLDAAGTEEITLDDTIIEKLPEHTPDGSGWHSDENNHWNQCECGEKINLAPHSFVWVTDKEATATENGSRHEECSVCGYAKAAVDIPVIGSTDPSEPGNPGGSSKPSTSKPNISETGSSAGSSEVNGDKKVPQTGDMSDLTIWISLFILAGIGMTGTIIYRKKTVCNKK